MLYANEYVIGDHNAHLFTAGQPLAAGRGLGLVPRPATCPPLCYARSAPFKDVNIPLIARADWPQVIRDQVASQSRLSDVRLTGDNGKPIPSLDQGQWGYCWAHSTTHAVMLTRARMGLPYVPLSAFAVAATIKRGANEGGWGAQSLDFAAARGIPSQAKWPQGDANYRHYDTADVWADAARHKVVEGWVDLAAAQYDRTLSFDQECSLLMSLVTCVKDENWWGHSIDGLDVVDGAAAFRSRFNRAASGKLLTLAEHDVVWAMSHPVTGGYGIRIWNSWSDSWGDRGMSVLTGDKAVSDGGVAPREITVAA